MPAEIHTLPRPVSPAEILHDEVVAGLRADLRKANDENRKLRAFTAAIEAGEINANEVNLITEALSALAEHKRAIAFEMEKAARQMGWLLDKAKGAELITAAGRMNRAAADARDLRDKFDVGGNSYIMPGDA